MHELRQRISRNRHHWRASYRWISHAHGRLRDSQLVAAPGSLDSRLDFADRTLVARLDLGCKPLEWAAIQWILKCHGHTAAGGNRGYCCCCSTLLLAHGSPVRCDVRQSVCGYSGAAGEGWRGGGEGSG